MIHYNDDLLELLLFLLEDIIDLLLEIDLLFFCLFIDTTTLSNSLTLSISLRITDFNYVFSE